MSASTHCAMVMKPLAEARWEAVLTLAAAIEVARSGDIPPLPAAEFDALDGYVVMPQASLDAAVAAAAWERGPAMSLRAALDAAPPELRIGGSARVEPCAASMGIP